MRSFALIFTFLNTLGVSTATFGVDVSQSTSSSSFACLAEAGYIFAIVRVYESSGQVDSNGPATIRNAWAGGMSYVDGYIFPCFDCGNAAKQIDDTITNLASSNVTYGMLWIDVEGSQYWGSSQSSNVAFIEEMANEGVAKGLSIGIYTSSSQWSAICGTSTALSQYPLWYPHYQSPAEPNFDDWVSFGGWTSPAIKQYQGTTTLCSAGVDLSYY